MSESTIPPAPPGWKKTISELVAETTSGLRKSVGPYEIEWARDYERSLLPADVRFPKEGDLYEALQDVQIDYLTSWAAPFTGSGKGILKGYGQASRYATDQHLPRSSRLPSA